MVDGKRREPQFHADSVAFFREDPERVIALAHPIRLKVLKLADTRDVSAKDAAAAIGEPISKVSYHFRVLAEHGLIQLVSQAQRRGAIESYYRATVVLDIDEESWGRLDPWMKRHLVSAQLQELTSEQLKAVEAGGFEFDEAVFGNAYFAADATAITEIRAAIDAFYARLEAIDADLRTRTEGGAPGPHAGVNVSFNFWAAERGAAGMGPSVFTASGPTFELIPKDSFEPGQREVPEPS